MLLKRGKALLIDFFLLFLFPWYWVFFVMIWKRAMRQVEALKNRTKRDVL